MANSLGSWFGLALGIEAASFAKRSGKWDSGTGNGIGEREFGSGEK